MNPTGAYFPSPAQWILFLLLSVTILACIIVLTPLKQVKRVSKLTRVRLICLILAITLAAAGLLLFLLGISWIWALVSFERELSQSLQYLTQIFPRLTLQAQDINSAAPYYLVAISIAIIGSGIGLIRWQNWARLVVGVISLALLILAASISPFLVLSRPVFQVQTWFVFILMEAIIGIATGIVWLMTLPETRMRFLRS
jgi:hypothetical protein